MKIKYLLEEGLIDLIRFDDHISLVNLRRLPVKMVSQGREVWLETKKEKISLANLEKYTKIAQ